MMKIKADRMGELGRFGFAKIADRYWRFDNTPDLSGCDVGIMRDGTVSLGTGDYAARALTEGFDALIDLIKAGMVEGA